MNPVFKSLTFSILLLIMSCSDDPGSPSLDVVDHAGVIESETPIHTRTAMDGTEEAYPETNPQVPTDWITVAAGKNFTIQGPPGTVYIPKQGIDSFVGEIQFQHNQLLFDFGMYSGRFGDDPSRTEPCLIDGRQARISVSTNNGSDGNLVWLKVQDVYAGQKWRTGLSIRCSTTDTQALETIVLMFKTIDFAEQPG